MSLEDTKDDMPHFNFDQKYIPMGDSKSSCFHLKYRSKKLPLVDFDEFDSLQNLPECKGHNVEAWNDDDPITGISLLVWKEFRNEHKD